MPHNLNGRLQQRVSGYKNANQEKDEKLREKEVHDKQQDQEDGTETIRGKKT